MSFLTKKFSDRCGHAKRTRSAVLPGSPRQASSHLRRHLGPFQSSLIDSLDLFSGFKNGDLTEIQW